MRKKLLATLLAVVLLLGLIPLTSIGGGVAYAASAPPRATAIDATKVDLGENVKVLYAQVIPGTPTLVEEEGCFYNCGTINIYVDSIPSDATELKWSSASVKAALNIDWGSYSYYPDEGGQEFYDVTPKAEDSWKVKNAQCFLGTDANWDGPVNCYDVAIYEGICPPLATAIDATKVDLGENVKVLYAQVIPGTPTLVEEEGCFYNCGTINIYVDSIPADATELKWSSASVKAALNIDWGSYSYYPDAGGQEFYDVTPKAEDSWKVKNAQCFLGTDANWDGPVNCYDVAIYEGGVREQGVVLSDGVASRTSDTTAGITFSASEAGSYVWAWADEGTTPEKPTAMEPVEMSAGVNTFTVDNLTAGAKKLRIWATDASGNNAADPLDISIYAFTSAGWPQLTSFSFGDGTWSVNGITLTNENIQLVNYEKLAPYTTGDTTKFYAGEVIIRYDGKAAQPGPSQANLTGWTAAAAAPAGFSDLSVSSLSKTPSLDLREKDYISVSAKSGDTTYTYCYKVAVSCSEFLCEYPDTWKPGESNSEFTYSPTSYQRTYNNWQMLSGGVKYTWGTTSDKENLNFTSGSDSFTLTNGEGNTQTYTVTLDMPWEFEVLPQKGYDLSKLSADTETLSGYQDLSKPYDTVTKDIRSGRAVTVSIKPTGDNKNKVIDAVTLTKSRDKTAISASDIKITGNTFSFVMPNDCVEVTGITFKEDTSERYTISTSATRYRNESIYAMGTVTITDGENPIGDAHAGNEVTVTATPVEHAAYDFNFVRWEAEGVALTDEQKAAATMTFEMPAQNVTLTAVFEKQGVKLSFSASPASALSGVDLVSMVQGNYMTFFTSHEDTVKPGAEIAVRPSGTSQFVLVGYEVKDQAGNNISYEVGDFDGCQFTVPENATSISVVAKYRAKAFSTITMGSNDTAMGSASATVEGKPVGAAVTEGATVTVTATAKFRYKFTSWSAAYADGSTVDFELTSAEENPNVATFTVPTSGKGIVITANFERDETQNSNLCQLTGVGLYDEETKIGMLSKSGLNYTITLPVDTDTANLADMILKLTISEFATVTKENDPGKNWVEGAPCGMALDTQTKFTVTAEDGTTNVYTITIKKAAAPNAPTLSNGSATRTSKTGATVKFTSSEAGNYFYKVVDHGATAPTADEIMKSTTKGTASTGEITFTLSNLTEDARDIYIVVVSAAGGESAPLKVEIPAYGSGTDTPDTGAYKISISAPKGGKITTNRTKADAGDEIIVTVTPDNGYQMVSGSLTYTLAKEGGETKTITNGRFTMPAGDVSITCKWETATTTAKGITSFSINGVAGAVNNSTNTITITMPRGTDVTKLTPVIATNGVKSLTPGNGVTVDFTNAVTYTAAMEDGSSKTYTVTVYVDKGTLADQFWDKLTDFATQVPWWQYAEKQQSTSKYPKYW